MRQLQTFKGFKVVSENTDSIVNYGIKAIGVWKNCPHPEKYLHPEPKITKQDENTFIDGTELSNIALEVPELPEGVIIRIGFLF